MESKYLLIGILTIGIVFILYSLMPTQENMHLGTIIQLQDKDPQDLYLTTDPIPYDPWLHNSMYYWDLRTGRPYDVPHTLDYEGYYGADY